MRRLKNVIFCVILKNIFPLFCIIAFNLAVQAETLEEERDLSGYFGAFSGAFVLLDAANNKWLRYHPELCRERVSPLSTFKIPNSLIALETGVAEGPDFRLPWDGVIRSVETWSFFAAHITGGKTASGREALRITEEILADLYILTAR